MPVTLQLLDKTGQVYIDLLGEELDKIVRHEAELIDRPLMGSVSLIAYALFIFCESMIQVGSGLEKVLAVRCRVKPRGIMHPRPSSLLPRLPPAPHALSPNPSPVTSHRGGGGLAAGSAARGAKQHGGSEGCGRGRLGTLGWQIQQLGSAAQV